MKNWSKVGQMVKRYRERAKMSQLGLGQKLGFGSGQFISNMERGLAIMSLPAMNKMAIALKMNREELAKEIVSVYRLKVETALGLRGKKKAASRVRASKSVSVQSGAIGLQ